MLKKFLYIGALFLTACSCFLTASGMGSLFPGLGIFIFIICVTLDTLRFFTSDYLICNFNHIGRMKYLTVGVLAGLFCLSTVGIYARLDSSISSSMKEQIHAAAAYNKAATNAATSQDIDRGGYEVALADYNAQLANFTQQKEACVGKPDADIEKCTRTYNANLNAAKKRLDDARNTYKASMSVVTETAKETAESQGEIAGILTTMCKITGGACDTTAGLQRSLSIIILLLIFGLDFFALNILFIVNSDDNKETRDRKRKLRELLKDRFALGKKKAPESATVTKVEDAPPIIKKARGGKAKADRWESQAPLKVVAKRKGGQND